MPIIGGVNLGHLTDYLFVFTNGSVLAKWEATSHGYLGDVGVNGLVANEQTGARFPYAGTIYTNASTEGVWQAIINQNPGQAFGATDQVARIAALEADLQNALAKIDALAPTAGFESRSSASLNGLNTQNGINEVFVINITSGLKFSAKIYITGDPGDVFILRWDTDPQTPGYQGQVFPMTGGAIVPRGGLTPANFINVAGNMTSLGAGTNPPLPYPQGPRYDNGAGALINGGSDWSGGGFFTGYWLTTGDPVTGRTQDFHGAIFVGGWYSTTTSLHLFSETSGVHITPNPATVSLPVIAVEKLVSVTGGATFRKADTPPGPTLIAPTNPQFQFVVNNPGNVPLTGITLADSSLGPIPVPTTTLEPGESFSLTVPGAFGAGEQCNSVTAGGTFETTTVTAADTACYFGVTPGIAVEKLVSVDNGATFEAAPTPPGPTLTAPTNPQFMYVVSNTGDVTLTNIAVVDTSLGSVTVPTMALAPGESFTVTVPGTFAAGQQCNSVTARGTFETVTVTASDTACYYGVAASVGIHKLVSVDGGVTFQVAPVSPGPTLTAPTNPQFMLVLSNEGNVPLTNVTLIDSSLGPITLPVSTLAPGAYLFVAAGGTFAPGEQCNTATVSGTSDTVTVAASDSACYLGLPATTTNVDKAASGDGGE